MEPVNVVVLRACGRSGEYAQPGRLSFDAADPRE
jgi:hypothetical protein